MYSSRDGFQPPLIWSVLYKRFYCISMVPGKICQLVKTSSMTSEGRREDLSQVTEAALHRIMLHKFHYSCWWGVKCTVFLRVFALQTQYTALCSLPIPLSYESIRDWLRCDQSTDVSSTPAGSNMNHTPATHSSHTNELSA